MFFKSRKFMLARFALILALLSGLYGVMPAEANSSMAPQILISTPSSPIGMDSGESKLIPYNFEELGNVSGEITSRTYRFYTQYDEPLSEPMGPYPTRIKVNALQTNHWNELVNLPQSVVTKARLMKKYAVVLKTTFAGKSLSGAGFKTQASLLLLLPPDAFSKAFPSDGSVVPPANQSLHWNSSVGAIDYQYCFDTINNNSCDTDWTGTYWLGTYDTNAALQNLPPNTTFYWQVRAKNMAGITDGHKGKWWSFSTISEDRIPPTVLSITRADGNPTNAATVNFTVTFSEPVANVYSNDF